MFNIEVDLLVNDFTTLLPTDGRRLIRFYANMLICNTIPTSFNTDWSLEFGNESDGYIIRSTPRLYANGSCNCMISRDCATLLRIGPSDVILPGLVTGCTPIEGLRMSTLECFYSSDCINSILAYLNYYTDIDGSPPTNFTRSAPPDLTVSPLENVNMSKFAVATSIGTLMDELFIDSWNVTSSYEQYFTACAPTTCRYRYSARNNVIYIVTLLLSLYGGLSVGLRFIAWNMTILYRWLKKRLLSRRTPVQPFLDDKAVTTMNIS